MNMNRRSPHPQLQPAVPLPNGRPAQMPYSPSSFSHQQPFLPYQGSYHPYQHVPQYSRPPHQWAPYAMSVPMGRAYQQYPQMHAYPMPQYHPPTRPPAQQAQSSSSMHSLQGMLSPASSTTSLPVPPPIPALPPSPRPAPSSSPAPASPGLAASQRTQFYPPLPWQSFEGEFPSKKPRRRRKPNPQSSTIPVELPSRPKIADVEHPSSVPAEALSLTESADTTCGPSSLTDKDFAIDSNDSSDMLSTKAPGGPRSVASYETIPKASNPSLLTPATRSIIPAVPAVTIPTASRNAKQGPLDVPEIITSQTSQNTEQLTGPAGASSTTNGETTDTSPLSTALCKDPVAEGPPKSWADLVRMKVAPFNDASPGGMEASNGQSNGLHPGKAGSLGEALNAYNVKDRLHANKATFLEPRGLVNTGNTCYINSILQVLVFCVPFYSFLEQVSHQAVHSFKSDTPIMDAMIMFMREFRVIDAAGSIDQLRLRLKENELELYGQPLTPTFVYDVIRQLPRFSSMRRGAQQDAEEFLGFLLEGLHDECSAAMAPSTLQSNTHALLTVDAGVSRPSQSADQFAADDNGWLEVGPKQRAAITRSSGMIATESPITKIFGGKLRSELRVPGMKNSVTLEPYQPLQLDIGAQSVVNIIDALKGLTRPETLHGDFGSPRGPGSLATKQVTIETLPRVLILHLKRFQYDNAGGTQKIWKKIGYPLDLEIPKEVFPQHKRGGLMAHGGLPKYQLIGVVYHHGKHAGGGHYTVDVRRQEGREWVRLDDTHITRIRKEDVAEGGSEEDPKVLAAVLEQHKNDSKSGRKDNVYAQIAGEDEELSDMGEPWSQVNGSAQGPNATGKKWSGVANGLASPTNSSGKMTPIHRTDIKDNKVAYILFYQRVD